MVRGLELDCSFKVSYTDRMKNRVTTSVPTKVEVFAYSEHDFDGILVNYELLGLRYKYNNKEVIHRQDGTYSVTFTLIGCRDERG